MSVELMMFYGNIANQKELLKELNINCANMDFDELDGEIIKWGYGRWGDELLNHLKGYYSFCLYDSVQETIFGARDPFGVIPFYYYENVENGFWASDSIKEIIKKTGGADISKDAISLFFTFSYIPGEETAFKSIKKLMPGMMLVVRNGRIEKKSFCNYAEKQKCVLSRDRYKEMIVENTRKATKDLPQEKAVFFLSSGLDSNYIYGMSDGKDAVTIGFEDEELNESIVTKKNVSSYGKNVEELLIDSNTFFSSIRECISYMEQPIGSPSAVPYMLACKTACSKYRTVYTGDGADELFAGYDIYRYYEEFNEKIPYMGKCFVFGEGEKKELFKMNDINENIPLNVVKKYSAMSNTDKLTYMMDLDLKLWLEADSFSCSYKMAKAYGLSIKMPFVNEEMYKIGYEIPNEYKLKRYGKDIIREIVAENISPEIANAKKRGFVTPVRKWMKENWFELISETVLRGTAAQKYFNKSYVEELLKRYKCGEEKLWRKIWLLYSFCIWFEMQ